MIDTIARRNFLKSGLALSALSSIHGLSPVSAAAAQTTTSQISGAEDRQTWIEILTRVSNPLLQALSEGKLKSTMPVEAPHGNVEERKRFVYLEATARLLAGIAPWIESGATTGAEGKLRQQHAELARKAIQSGTDPHSPDFFNFNQGTQPVVDASFLGLAILRAPTALWQNLDKPTQQNVIAALQSTRVILPYYNNWILFSAMIEATLAFMGVWWDPMRVDLALRTVDSWYKGDGVYGDGPAFHWDSYNSFVIQPYLLNILDTVSKSNSTWNNYRPVMLARAQRYAAIQERWISPEGTFPAIGRSECYRFGAFQLLAEISLRRKLPAGVTPEQVRCALTAVMRRMIDAPGTFDAQGWLQLGFCGHQPQLAESYLSSGSCYLCSVAWLPLGLPASEPFWAGEPKPWTGKKIWSGVDISEDHALADEFCKASAT